ncbi:MAG: PHP domain-containing protein [Gemmatimonadota bacterium]
MRLDLHTHTTASDGAFSPSQLIEAAVAGRLDAVAITDHDSVEGVDEALQAAQDLPLEVIPGIEVSSTLDGREVHMLGYFVDLSNAPLRAHGHRASNRREERLREMIQRLEEDEGLSIPFETVLDAAGPEQFTLGRPHLARAMTTLGFVASPDEAFLRYLSNDHPAYVPTDLVTPAEAVELIQQAGGVSVWAHPGREDLSVLLSDLVDAGLQGLEVFRPRNSARWVLELEGLARHYGLVVSGGSDWHGPAGGSDLGDFHVGADEVGRLLELGGL